MNTFNVSLLAGLISCAVAGALQAQAATNACFTQMTVRRASSSPSGDPCQYTVQAVQNGSSSERRLYCGDHHFASLILDSNGALAIRPHPGVDPNGWGSTLYLQPFFPGAVLRGTTLSELVFQHGGLHATFSGIVSRGAGDSYGNWDGDLQFVYNPTNKTLDATGSYGIRLPGWITTETGDLNIYKLASCLNTGVPLVLGGTGSTGDMQTPVNYVLGSTPQYWDPVEEPGHFPASTCGTLTVYLDGAFNNIDTAAQGYCPIKPAWKPSVMVQLHDPGWNTMTFGGFYTLSEAANFWSDNIAITPLVRATQSLTNFQYDVWMRSAAPPADGLGESIDLAVLCTNCPPDQIDVFKADQPSGPYNWLLGSVFPAGGGVYTGTVQAIQSSTGASASGFLKLKSHCQ